MLENVSSQPNPDSTRPIELAPNSPAFADKLIADLSSFTTLNNIQIQRLTIDIQRLHDSIYKFDPKQPIYPHFRKLIESRKSLESAISEDFESFQIILNAIINSDYDLFVLLPSLNEKLYSSLELIESLNLLLEKLTKNADIAKLKNSCSTSFVTITMEHFNPATDSINSEHKRFMILGKAPLSIKKFDIIIDRLSNLLRKFETLSGLMDASNYRLVYNKYEKNRKYVEADKTRTFKKIISFFSEVPHIESIEDQKTKTILIMIQKIVSIAQQAETNQEEIIHLLQQGLKDESEISKDRA
jgi:hypothetical protein